jgi:hypothetical protein
VNGKPVTILEAKPANELGVPQFKVGQEFVIEIKNESNEDLFVYLYALGTSGSVSLMELPLGVDEKLPPACRSVNTRGTLISSHRLRSPRISDSC